jgi:hypothetical protein
MLRGIHTSTLPPPITCWRRLSDQSRGQSQHSYTVRSSPSGCPLFIAKSILRLQAVNIAAVGPAQTSALLAKYTCPGRFFDNESTLNTMPPYGVGTWCPSMVISRAHSQRAESQWKSWLCTYLVSRLYDLGYRVKPYALRANANNIQQAIAQQADLLGNFAFTIVYAGPASTYYCKIQMCLVSRG